MPSAIDATKPADSSPALTSDLRANLLTAKNEITALQAADLTLAPKGLVTASGLTMSTNKLLGRNTAATGVIEEITLGTNLSMTGTTLNAAGTSPGGSGSELQCRGGASTFSAISSSSVSGADVTLGGLLTMNYGGGGAFDQHIVLNTSGNGQTVIGGYNGHFFVRSGTGGTRRMSLWTDNRTNATGIELRSSDNYRWSSTSDATGDPDVGMQRVGARVMGVNDGSVGVWGDIKARNHIIASGVIATDAAAPTIASAGTIAPTTAIAFVSGTTTISTITAPSPISSGGGQITLIPTGLWSTNTAGNIALATTAVVSKALTMTYDVTTAKWYPSY